jgi:hypothetical protein
MLHLLLGKCSPVRAAAVIAAVASSADSGGPSGDQRPNSKQHAHVSVPQCAHTAGDGTPEHVLRDGGGRKHSATLGRGGGGVWGGGGRVVHPPIRQ